MRKKNLKLSVDAIRVLVPGHGACIATDLITVEGHRVGFMYRERPDNDLDSGWRFLAGTECDAYLENADHHAIYDVNTIANYDPDVIAFLDRPVGTAFERDQKGVFTLVEGPPDFESPTEVDRFPPVEGRYSITESWSITLPSPFKRRFEDGACVLWRPGFTIFMSAYGNDRALPKASRLDQLRSDVSAGAFDFLHESIGQLERLAYRLDENDDDGRRPAFYGFIVGESGHLLLAMYFNREQDVDLARVLWRSVEPSSNEI